MNNNKLNTVWQELIEKDDRTSPAEYPEALAAAKAALSPAQPGAQNNGVVGEAK